MAHDRKAVGDSRRQAAREVYNKIDAGHGREEAGRRVESEWAESGRAESGSLSGWEAENGAERETGRNRDGVRARLRGRIVEELTECRNMDDQELPERIDTAIRDIGQGVYLPLEERIWLRGSLYDSFCRLDILQELTDDRSVPEIMASRAGTIFIERNGKVELWKDRFEKPEQLEDIAQQTVDRVNRVVNVSSPIVDARLEGSSRAHAVLPPVSLDGPAVTIREPPEPITMERLIRFGAATWEGTEFLQKLVEAGCNMSISGGTNSGRTTLLNALSAYIPTGERAIIIRDSAEFQTIQMPNLVCMETRNASMEGEGEITMSRLVRAFLRMNPSRIIVGEVRGKETLDILQAANTGHAGSLSTKHGNSPRDMISRPETMVLVVAELPLAVIRSQIVSTLDMMIHLGRLRGGSRKVLSITETGECRNGEMELEPLHEYDREEETLRKRGELTYREKLGAAGYCQRREEGKTGRNGDRTKEGPVDWVGA